MMSRKERERLKIYGRVKRAEVNLREAAERRQVSYFLSKLL
jgi:hypothetical protein